jgi:hypothetical protein
MLEEINKDIKEQEKRQKEQEKQQASMSSVPNYNQIMRGAQSSIPKFSMPSFSK